MRKLIGLFVALFIATSTGQVFAQDILQKINGNSVFFVKNSTNSDQAQYVESKIVDILLKNELKITTDEIKTNFILNVSHIAFEIIIRDAVFNTHVSIGIQIIDPKNSLIISNSSLEGYCKNSRRNADIIEPLGAIDDAFADWEN